jgi:hypothetical protein
VEYFHKWEPCGTDAFGNETGVVRGRGVCVCVGGILSLSPMRPCLTLYHIPPWCPNRTASSSSSTAAAAAALSLSLPLPTCLILMRASLPTGVSQDRILVERPCCCCSLSLSLFSLSLSRSLTQLFTLTQRFTLTKLKNILPHWCLAGPHLGRAALLLLSLSLYLFSLSLSLALSPNYSHSHNDSHSPN